VAVVTSFHGSPFAVGICTFGVFLAVNVVLRSDFAFAIGGIFLTYLASLVFGLSRRKRAR
jgi:hypothetical protein